MLVYSEPSAALLKGAFFHKVAPETSRPTTTPSVLFLQRLQIKPLLAPPLRALKQGSLSVRIGGSGCQSLRRAFAWNPLQRRVHRRMDRETSLGGGAMPPPPLPFHRKEAALNSQREREKETSWAYLWGKLSRGRGGRCIPVRPRLPPQLGPLTRVPALSRLQASHAHAGESYAPPNAGLLPLFTPALQPLPSAFPLPGVGRTEQRLGPRGMMSMLKAFPGRNRMQAAARLNVNL